MQIRKCFFRFSMLFFLLLLLITCFLINSCGVSSGIDNVSREPTDLFSTQTPAAEPTPTLAASPSATTIFDLTPTSTPGPLPSASITSTPEIITPEPTDSTARVIMVGDMLMHDGVINSGNSGEGYNFDHLFTNILSDVRSADIAIVNQEVIIAGAEYGISGYPRFNAPLELADSLVDAGFNVIASASNHTLDKGKDAMLFSLANWQSKYPDISVVGMHDSSGDSEEITVRDVNGIRFALLNYTYGLNAFGNTFLQQDPYLVDILEEARVRADIARAKDIADITIILVHWGTEYTHTPSQVQRNWANIFLECGVDLVLGTHPHVIQPIEWLEREDGHKMLVYWSLGNFVNCTSGRGTGRGARMLGAMSDVIFIKDKNGATTIQSAVAHPLITHIDYSQYGITTYLFKNYSEALFADNQARTFDSGFSYQYCIDTFRTILGDFLA